RPTMSTPEFQSMAGRVSDHQRESRGSLQTRAECAMTLDPNCHTRTCQEATPLQEPQLTRGTSASSHRSWQSTAFWSDLDYEIIDRKSTRLNSSHVAIS